MSSTRQIAANRANGARSRGPITSEGKRASAANSALSTGPVTPEGKAASSRNALRHGILARALLLDNESIESFSDILSALQEELQPATGIENRYVETMAITEWRRLRLICIEREQMAIESRRQEENAPATEGESLIDPIRYKALAFRALCDQSDAQEILNRHEVRYDRQYQRAFNNLRAYRADRQKNKKIEETK